MSAKYIQTIVIGGGQAGLSVGYHLKRLRRPFLILDANARVGDSWRQRWDSLRLFTPARFDALDGMPFPAPANAFPTKDEMADYLEAYAAHFSLPIEHGVKVQRLSRNGDRYILNAGSQTYEADQVVVAMANFQEPRVPEFAGDLDGRIVQFHSRDYRNPSQLCSGAVLLVGAGNSGSEIALDVARAGHRVWMSGRDTGSVPFRLGGLLGRLFFTRFVLRFVFHRLLTLDTPVGRKVRARVLHHGGALIRVKARDLAAAHVERTARTVGVKDGRPLLEDGRVLDVANVIWCTGFHPASSWIDLPVFEPDGEPKQDRGRVRGEPGLYFVGRFFLYAMSSTMIHGVGRDAEQVAEFIAARTAAPRSAVPVSDSRLPDAAAAAVAGRVA
ncbi:MAG TPA: NAD(P)-binding domain-containing protein [Vicinamibacterales bacterium]